LNALAYADASIAGLLDGFRARGLYDRTMFVIFGDHGEAFGQHSGNAGHTFFLYDENVRVPLLIVIPGVTNGARRSSSVASLVDVAPTILDALGLPDDRAADGVSLLEPRDRLALFLTDYSLGWLGLRDGCLKYLYEIDAQRSKLFDVCADPGEQHDVSARDPDRVARYRDQIEQWSAVTRSGQRP
jgi:arylsulfatase A-like enzyme